MLGKIKLRGTSNNEERYGYNITDAEITNDNKANYYGRAVEIDPTRDCAVKLATDGGTVYGRILVIEVEMTGEKVCTVETLGGLNLPVIAGTNTLTRGVTPVGAGAGFIKDGTEESTRIFVVDISDIAVDQTATVMFH